MREIRTYGSVRGALSNERPYRDHIAVRWQSRVASMTVASSDAAMPAPLLSERSYASVH